jgi:hypothetical protein
MVALQIDPAKLMDMSSFHQPSLPTVLARLRIDGEAA